MVLSALFKPRPAITAGRALFVSATQQARRPIFYADWGAPDTREGRFELMSLHVALLTRRLKGWGPQAVETAQGLIDAYFESLDISLREMGVGDLSMSKKMKKLGQAFYGRAKAYDEALSDDAALDDFFARTLEIDEAAASHFSDYAKAVVEALDAEPLDRLLAGEANWPEPGR